jgi:YtcA family
MPRFRDMQMELRRSPNLGRLRLVGIAAGASLILASTGCSRAPSLNILGSFFPSWILCGVVGIVLTVVARILFVRANFEKELSPLVLVYPCLAAFFTFSIWLLVFS